MTSGISWSCAVQTSRSWDWQRAITAISALLPTKFNGMHSRWSWAPCANWNCWTPDTLRWSKQMDRILVQSWTTVESWDRSGSKSVHPMSFDVFWQEVIQTVSNLSSMSQIATWFQWAKSKSGKPWQVCQPDPPDCCLCDGRFLAMPAQTQEAPETGVLLLWRERDQIILQTQNIQRESY